ncbi:MAG: hypothetical protein WBN22_01895 [Verrucomicrobiia bacterium]
MVKIGLADGDGQWMFLSAWDNKVHPQKSERSKMVTIRAEQRKIRFGTPVAFTVCVEILVSAHRIYFAAFGEAHAALTPPVVLISS